MYLSSAFRKFLPSAAKRPTTDSLLLHPQLPKQKRIHICELFDLLGYWLACAVAWFGFYP
jgi:hypothetical protein